MPGYRYDLDMIEKKVGLFRKMLMDKEGVTDNLVEKDEYGRPL